MKKFHLYLIGFIIIYLILGGVIVFPLIQGIQENSKELSLQREKLATLTKQEQGLIGFKKAYQELEPDLKEAKQHFIDSEAPVDFLDFLENTASSSNISLEVSSAQYNPESEQQKAFFLFNMSTIGPFPQVLEFTEKLENSPYLVRIQDLMINRISEKETASEMKKEVKATLSIKVYAQ